MIPSNGESNGSGMEKKMEPYIPLGIRVLAECIGHEIQFLRS